MRILLTGTTGYIGRRLLPVLVKQGYEVICPVRDKRRFNYQDFDEDSLKKITVVEVDFANPNSLANLPKNIDVAYFLIHSMTSSDPNFEYMEYTIAQNFANYVAGSEAQQIIYLGGIANDINLSQHLRSRQKVENILKSSRIPLTVLRAGIIIGSGSGSFEIIRDLVEKLPVMVAPKWLRIKCQPISVLNVLEYLISVIRNQECYHKVFDIGGKDILTYQEMLLGYAKVRGLKRFFIEVPVLTPKLSSLWLYLVTNTSFNLARNLVDSIKNEVVVDENKSITNVVKIENVHGYREAIHQTLNQIESREVISSWKDSFYNTDYNKTFIQHQKVPQYGCFKDHREMLIKGDPDDVVKRIWTIGGNNGWYYGNWLWRIRGFLDEIVGGVGLRRGRRNQSELKHGDSLDFWRVLDADLAQKRLLLFAEMKLPGEAWLEFKVSNEGTKARLLQTATFRPLGILGRLYWIILIPLHGIIFKGMAKRIANA